MSLWDDLSLWLFCAALVYAGSECRTDPPADPPSRPSAANKPLTYEPNPPDPVYPPSRYIPGPKVKHPRFRYVHGERVPYDHTPSDHEWDHFDHSTDECHD